MAVDQRTRRNAPGQCTPREHGFKVRLAVGGDEECLQRGGVTGSGGAIVAPPPWLAVAGGTEGGTNFNVCCRDDPGAWRRHGFERKA